MSITQIFSIIVSAIVFFTVIRTLMKNKLDESNSIFWLLIGSLIFVTAVFPNIVDRIAWWLHIDYTPTLLFLVSSVLLFLICFKSSMDISRLDARVTELAISYSIIHEENHQLKLKLAAYEENHQLKLMLAAYENELVSPGGCLKPEDG